MGTVPLPHLFAVGEVVTADNINTYNSGITYLENPPQFSGYQAAAQSIPNATFTSVAIDTSETDPYNGHSNVTNNSRYTAQVAGWYRLSGLICFVVNGTGERRGMYAKNGTGITATQTQGPATAVSVSGLAMPTRLVFLNINDYVELQAWQNSGGALNTNGGGTACCFFSAVWMHI